MEQVYPPTYFNCTEKLTDLDEYFESFAQLTKFISEKDVSADHEQLLKRKLSELIDCKESSLGDISKQCSVNLLSVNGEIDPIDVHSFSRFTMKLQRDYGTPEAAKNLETIKAKMLYNKIAPRQKEFSNVILKRDAKDDIRNVSFNDVLVFVRVYTPYPAGHKRLRIGDKLKCSHEIVALTRNKLSMLRDKILCANDNGFSLEIDELPHKAVMNVKVDYPSGLIGIDDTLYIDMRESNAIDYSDVIKEWGVKKNIANFKVFHMNEVEIKDLNFRIGYPYIYQHRGNCEHIIVFSDVRLVKKSDPLCSSKYPFYHSVNRYNSERCNICHSASAQWVVCECDRLPHDRTFLCQDCFVSYNYLDGKKIGTFKAYRYYNKSSVL